MISDFEKALANIALTEYRDFEQYDEADDKLAKRIRQYWTTMEWTFPGVGTAWSAVFVSWCLKTAGASKKEFLFAQGHAKFVHWAIQNADTDSGLFRGYRIDECAVSVGDLIHNNRPGKNLTFAYAAGHDKYESHSAIVTSTGQDSDGHFAITIGGNEGKPGSVGRRRVALNEDGLVVQRKNSPYISVVQSLK